MKPIPIKYMRFQDERQDGPGIHTASSVTSAYGDSVRSRHTIEYHPWVQSFWVRYFDRAAMAANATVVDECYIPIARVMNWKPVEPILPPSPATADKRKTKSKK